MFDTNLSKVVIFLAVTQLRFVYSQWWDDYNSQYYYSAYSQMGYPCPYSQDGYDYTPYGQTGYPYNAYMITGSYGDYDQMYDSYYNDAIQPIIIVMENVDRRNEFYIDDIISLSLDIVKNLPKDCSSSCGCSCECRNKGRENYDFYSECNRGSKCKCDSCRSSGKGCKKSGRNSECGCHCSRDESCWDCGCCKHIVIYECN